MKASNIYRLDRLSSIAHAKKGERHMYPKVATIYDQNPTRIRLVAQRRHRQGRPVLQAFLGIHLLVGLAAALAWNFLPV